jgi:hypothetical protein
LADGAVNNHAGLIWSIADLLRGDYKQSEYERVILPCQGGRAGSPALWTRRGLVSGYDRGPAQVAHGKDHTRSGDRAAAGLRGCGRIR